MAVDAAQMLVNFSESYGPIMTMVTSGAYVIGGAFAFIGIYSLKVYGESRTMMSQSSSLKTPIMYLLAAAMLIYLPSALDTFMYTTFGAKSSPISYTGGGTAPLIPFTVMSSVLRFVQIVGMIAFIRGWIIIAQSSKQGSQPQLAKALTHIFGGIFAINIIGTRDVISATFGLTF